MLTQEGYNHANGSLGSLNLYIFFQGGIQFIEEIHFSCIPLLLCLKKFVAIASHGNIVRIVCCGLVRISGSYDGVLISLCVVSVGIAVWFFDGHVLSVHNVTLHSVRNIFLLYLSD